MDFLFRSNHVTLLKYVNQKRKLQLFFLLILMIFGGFAEAATIGSVLPFLAFLSGESVHLNFLGIDRSLLATKEDGELFFIFTLVFLAFVVIASGIRILILWSQSRLVYSIGTEISTEVFRRSIYQAYSTYLNRHSSDVIAAISMKTGSILHGSLLPFLMVINSVFVVVVMITVLFVIDPIVTAVSIFVVSTFYLVFSKKTTKTLDKLGRDVSENSNFQVKTLQEAFGAFRNVIIDGRESYFVQRFNHIDRRLRRSQGSLQIIANLPRLIIEVIAIITFVLLAYSLVRFGKNPGELIPIFGAFAVGFQRLMPVGQQIYAGLATIRATKASLSDVLQLVSQPIPIHRQTSGDVEINYTKNRIKKRYLRIF